MSEVSLGTVYEVNKQLMVNEKPLDVIMLNRKCAEIYDWSLNKRFIMALCHEQRDFTLIAHKAYSDEDHAIKDLVEFLQCRGQVLSIDLQPNDAYEVWIKAKAINADNSEVQDEAFCYYIFDYSNGVMSI